MCQYDAPGFETVWSSIFDLKTLMIYRAEGDPRKKKFSADNRLCLNNSKKSTDFARSLRGEN